MFSVESRNNRLIKKVFSYKNLFNQCSIQYQNNINNNYIHTQYIYSIYVHIIKKWFKKSL